VLFLVVLKSFKFMELSRELQIICVTLAKCSRMLCSYLVTFMIIFMGFVFWGHIAFGTDMRAFSTPEYAFQTSLDMLIGNGDLPGMFDANRVMGPLYYILFTIVMTLILINVFIAIISEAYVAAIDESELPPAFPEPDSVLEMSKEALGSMKTVLLGYIKKFSLAITLNYCFSSSAGLSLEPGTNWEDISLSERVQLSVMSSFCYFFNLLVLFRFSDTSEGYHLLKFQIYENRLSIARCLDRVQKLEPHGTVALDILPVAIIFGDIHGIAEHYAKWLGPQAQRFSDQKLQFSLLDGLRHVAGSLNVLRQMSQLSLANEGRDDVFSSLSSWKDRVTLLRDYRNADIDFVATIDQFPLELVSLARQTVQDCLLGVPQPESDEMAQNQLANEVNV